MNKIERLLKRPLAYKIDKNDERILPTTLTSIFLLIYLISFITILILDDISFEELKKEILSKLLFPLLPTTLISILTFIIFYKEIMKVRNIQKLYELVFSSKYYINPPLVREGSNFSSGNIFKDLFSNKQLLSSRKDFKILYFPKFYITQRNKQMKIYIYLDGSKFQEQFLNLEKKLELVYGMTLTDKYIEDEYQVYILKTFNEKERINFIEIDNTENSIRFMKKLYWNFRKEPNALITGAIGSGKTYLIYYIIKEFLRKNYFIKIIDPKKSDLSQLENVSETKLVAYEKDDMITFLKEANEEMDRRYTEMLKTNSNFGKDFTAYSMKPYFLIIDEHAAFVSTLDVKEKKEVDSLIKNIILKGRQAGVNIIFAMQRADTSFIDGAVRDQLHFRLGLGNLSKDGYKMLFDNIEASYKELNTIGYGYYTILGKGKLPKIFLSPLVDKEEIIYKEIVKLIKSRGL